MVRGFLIFCLSTVLLLASACTKANNKSDVSKTDSVLPEYKREFINSCSNSIARNLKTKSLRISDDGVQVICDCGFQQVFGNMPAEEQEKNGRYILQTGEIPKGLDEAMDDAAAVCFKKAKDMGIRAKPISD